MSFDPPEGLTAEDEFRHPLHNAPSNVLFGVLVANNRVPSLDSANGLNCGLSKLMKGPDTSGKGQAAGQHYGRRGTAPKHGEGQEYGEQR